MDTQASNIVKFILSVAAFAIVCGGVPWALFGSSFAIRYLYLSIGIADAVAIIYLTFHRLNQHDGTVYSQFLNNLVRTQAFSSTSKILRAALFLVREAALRLTYWPFEIGLMALEERQQRAPNNAVRSALAKEFGPRIPLLTVSGMLAVNLTFLCLYYLFKFQNGGAFHVILTISMYVTIIWFLDFFFNPIEIQLRQAGTARQATTRFAMMCVLSLAAIISLVYTYRLLADPKTSLAGVVSDVLFAGRFNGEFKQAETAFYDALVKADFAGAWGALSGINQGFLVSIVACLLFYSTIVKRIWPALKGGASVFKRTEAESLTAAQTSLQLGAFDDARSYASELPIDHPFANLIDIREAFAQRRFEDAYGMIAQFVTQTRRQNRSKTIATLDRRETWYVLAIISNAGGIDGLLDLDFAVWSIDQPYLEERDLGYFIAIRRLYGGVPQVLVFAHYLYALLEGRGERATRFRDNVVSRFLMSAWRKRSSETINSENFAQTYLDLLAADIQSEKIRYISRNAPILRNAPSDLFAMAFGDYMDSAPGRRWLDVAAISGLQGVDRGYAVDTMFTLTSILAESADKDARQLAPQIAAVSTALEKQWGYRIFEHLGINSSTDDDLRETKSAFGSAFK